MKLEKDKILFVGFMLFSMFFGAGNLIFPPFLGQNAGNQTLPSVIGFLITAVILPVLAVIVVVLGIIIPLVVPAMKYGDMPGKVLVRVLAIILTVCILLAGSAYKKNQEESMANRAETYDVSCNI